MSLDDTKAREILTRSGVKFEVVDLSEARGKKRLAALFRGVTKTPTLWVEGSHRQKYEGVKAISDYATAQKTAG
jgi:glutaredoxin